MQLKILWFKYINHQKERSLLITAEYFEKIYIFVNNALYRWKMNYYFHHSFDLRYAWRFLSLLDYVSIFAIEQHTVRHAIYKPIEFHNITEKGWLSSDNTIKQPSINIEIF